MRVKMIQTVKSSNGEFAHFSRLIFLPVAPYVGLSIIGLQDRPKDDDPSEATIEHVYYDFRETCFVAELSTYEYREDKSVRDGEYGSATWIAENPYQDWKSLD
ncbi:hypothetical protein V5E97_06855 [Singulisphaera sp. Ch08]|uniref:Uncharacterized protein n=1 Tax=Singulisphaera sp. Ch08 TaxID=3120278 RepID=A0AAU7CJV8_9BACT